jgi:ribonuclease R
VDLRDVDVVTIDPPTARDFDDALSLTEDDEGNYELGVHIADVSHYVRFDDAIDREAYLRGTSVYLVDRVLPMLPEKLSNNLCSLNPGVDRLAMSVLVRLTPRGKFLGYRIEDTVIRSNRRLAYEDVQALFEGDPAARRELKPVLGLLERLRELALVLNKKRVKRGALDFDLPTSRVLLNEEGLPIDIQKIVRTESNRLVEEFMLLANEIVALHLKDRHRPGVYRVHEEPKEEKLQDLQDIIGRFGYVLRPKKDGSVPPKELQRVLAAATDTPEEMIVNTLVLRSLMRARYDVHPLGHYGLALRDYTHFTSPIRRYPDLLVHRILRMQSGRQKPAIPEDSRFLEWLDDAALRSSERERLAESAERDSIELKKIHFMERHLGDEFDGVVSGVEAFGFFVELESYHVSGLVHLNNLEDDYYEYLEDEYALVGTNSGRRFSLGDRVRVQVLAVKRELRQIDFLLLSAGGREEPEETEGTRRRRARADYEGNRPPRRRKGRRTGSETSDNKAARAGDAKSGAGKSGAGKSGAGKSGAGKSGEAKTGSARAGDAKSGAGKHGRRTRRRR